MIKGRRRRRRKRGNPECSATSSREKTRRAKFKWNKKASSEDARSSPVPSKDSEEFVSEEPTSHRQSSPQRNPSKLQKQPRVEASIAKQSILASEARPI